MPGGGVRRRGGGGSGRRGAINRRKQGGDDYLAQVGALAVPEHARARRGRSGTQGALAQARSVLTLTAVPRSLPCRETERRLISYCGAEVVVWVVLGLCWGRTRVGLLRWGRKWVGLLRWGRSERLVAPPPNVMC